jgi:hypothetical protein
MPQTRQAVLWVVYERHIDGRTHAVKGVCLQAEWDALKLADPGQYTLVRSGITSEAEAERLARGTPGGRVEVGPLDRLLGRLERRR